MEEVLRRAARLLYAVGQPRLRELAIGAGYQRDHHRHGLYLYSVASRQRTYGEWLLSEELKPHRDPDEPEVLGELEEIVDDLSRKAAVAVASCTSGLECRFDFLSAVRSFSGTSRVMKNIFALSGVAGLVSVFVAVGCGGQILDDRKGPIGGGGASSGGTASDTGGTTTTTGVGGGGATTAGSGGAGQTSGAGGAGGVPWTPHGSCLAIGVVDPNVSTAWPDPSHPPNPATIDTITMQPAGQDDYTPQAHMPIGTFGDAYVLSDGSTWDSGAGSAKYGTMSLDHISHEGPLIHYHMAPDDNLIVERTDYDGGDHSAHFRLETLGDWTITATSGSASGTLVAQGIIMMDEPANYVDSRFSYLSSPLCSAVTVTITYSLVNAVFDDNLFGGAFSYTDDFVVDAKSP